MGNGSRSVSWMSKVAFESISDGASNGVCVWCRYPPCYVLRCSAAMMTALLALQIVTGASGVDPFAFFQPSVTITAEDRRELARGRPITRILSAKDREVAVFGAIPVSIDGARFLAWIRHIEALKRGPYVPVIRRFAGPPRITDLLDLMLDDEDLSEIMACRPRDCGLKLSAGEMTELQRAAADAGSHWKAALQERFRHIVLERVQTYLETGVIAPYENHEDEVQPAQAFGRLVDHSLFLNERLPSFANHLRGAPTSSPAIESFVYWSKERLAEKPIIRVTHVHILRDDDPGLPDVLIAGKEIFTTHYINASLGVTALVRGNPGGPNYLVYLNRSEVDVLRGMFGGILRWFMQRRLRAEAAAILEGLRRRLESGEPPPDVRADDHDRTVGSTSHAKQNEARNQLPEPGFISEDSIGAGWSGWAPRMWVGLPARDRVDLRFFARADRPDPCTQRLSGRGSAW